MLVVLALVVWFVVSIPVTLLLGRMMAVIKATRRVAGPDPTETARPSVVTR